MKMWRWSFGLFFLLACRGLVTPFPPPTVEPTEDSIAPSGIWSLEYTGDCEARESESLDITIAGDGSISFKDYILTLDDNGQYVGSAQFTTPMPADGRDIVFIFEYQLTQDSHTMFTGTETLTEVGKGNETCPIQLVYVGE